MKYFVYSGYVSPDNYDCSEYPTYTITEFDTPDQVALFKKEFDENIYDECSNVIFRVFDGVERKLEAVERVTEYELV